MTRTPVAFTGRRPAGAGEGPAPGVAPGPTPPTARRGAPAGFHVLAKPSGPICNLDCSYCFFLEKEALYPGDRFRMSDDVLDNYVRQLLEAHVRPEVTVAWQGGEPTLMGAGFFRRALDACERHRRPGQRLAHTIQTNGTLLTDELCELFAANGFLVGISVDGPRELHDRYRVDKRGGPTFDKVMRGYELLRRHEVDTNILCTVHAANEERPLEVYRFFRDELGARHIQFIPIVEPAEDPTSPTGRRAGERSVSPAGWGRFLEAVFDEWVVCDVGAVFVSQFDAALASWAGVPPALCVFNETCGDALALEHNGDLYACDHFVDPEHLLGNILDTHMVDLVAAPAQRSFGRAKAELPGQCRRCDVRFACHGECPRNRFTATVDGEAGLNYLCAGYLSFFHHVDGPMRIMAGLLRDGRFADEVMGVLAGAGRNDPCPCGSGRKAKHCHQPLAARSGPRAGGGRAPGP